MDNDQLFQIAFDVRKRVLYFHDDIIKFRAWFDDYIKDRPSLVVECTLDEQQCQQECEHKSNKLLCPFVKEK